MIENPTEEQLRTLRGIVYIIINQINGKVYIGKTKRTFYKRYWSGRWWKYTNNYLKNAANKYGIENFKITILTHGITDNKELLQIERGFINQYDCISPKGYNFIEETDENHRIFNPESRMKQAITSCYGKIYRIKEIETGEIKEFRCPKEIIDKYDIRQQNLHSLFKGRLRTIKGICLPETDTEKRAEGDELKTLVDQFGCKYEFYNCHKFEKENLCGARMIERVVNKECFSSKSKDGRIFRLECTDLNSVEYLKSIGKFAPTQKYRMIILTRIIDNVDFYINPNDILTFCEKHNILRRDIHALTGKEQKTAKGFKLKELIYL